MFERDGRLSIDDVASPSAATTFVLANGQPANYGALPNTSSVLWLRIAIPELPPTGENDWILSLKEVRIQTLEDEGGGIGKVEWRVNGETLGLETRGLDPPVSEPLSQV